MLVTISVEQIDTQFALELHPTTGCRSTSLKAQTCIYGWGHILCVKHTDAHVPDPSVVKCGVCTETGVLCLYPVGGLAATRCRCCNFDHFYVVQYQLATSSSIELCVVVID